MHYLVPSRFGAQRGWPTVLKAIALGNLGAPAVRIFEPIVSPAGTSLRELSELGAACRTTEETEENVGVA